jgi:hypothetical protein
MNTVQELIEELKELRKDAFQGRGMTHNEVMNLTNDAIKLLESLSK